MILLIYGIQNLGQVNLLMQQKQTHRHREQTSVGPGGVAGRSGTL